MKSFFRIICILMMLMTGPVFAENGEQVENQEAKKQHLYGWTDDQGMLHITDSPGSVPEQYRSRTRKIESPKKKETLPDQQMRSREFLPEAEADADAGAKAEWQRRIRDWKQRLAGAEQQYQKLEQERNELLGVRGSAALAPIENRLKAEQLEQQMKNLQQEMAAARDMLENVIPEEARKAGVPPGWLRE